MPAGIDEGYLSHEKAKMGDYATPNRTCTNRSGTGGYCCVGAGQTLYVCALTRRQHLSA